MDLIQDIKNRDQMERSERMDDFDETRLVAAHNGDVMDVEGFDVLRVHTLLDLFNAPKSSICFISDDDSEVAEMVSRKPEINGCNFAQLVDIPGQISAFEASKWLAVFRQISFVSVLTDVADQRLIEESMTEEELKLSMAKKQHAQRARKDGEIRPLIDFDRVDTIEDDLDTSTEV